MKVSTLLNKSFRRFLSIVKRKYPLDPDHAKELPIFQYVTKTPKQNRMYVWGNMQMGALGLPYMKKDRLIEFLSRPKRLYFAEKLNIDKVTCGFGFTIFSVDSTENKLYGTGINTDSQFGSHKLKSSKPSEIIFFPQAIPLPFKSPDCKILKLSAGRAHSAILSEEGLYLLGNNAYGQCGRTIIENEDYSKNNFVNFVEKVDGKQIVDVECGQDHTLIITEEGALYSCGFGADGQTSLGHFNNQTSFSRVVGDCEKERIVKISSRSDFALALNDRGEVFGWGNAEYNQIRTKGDLQQVNRSIYLKDVCSLGRIKDISTGGSFCLVLNENGSVFVWGYGLLGVGPDVQESKNPINIPNQLFGLNDFNPDCKVVQVKCGLSHLAAVTNTGDLYTWGRNRFSCLGLAHDKDQPFPLKVALGAFVEEVHCGLDHTVALCKSYLTDDEENKKN